MEEVFQIVNEDTRKTTEQPVRKVINTGVVRGLANHSILIAKDGTERPIDDSAAPVREEGGELISEDAEAAVKDAGLIAAAQRVEHYEIAVYGTVSCYARLLGHSDAEKVLRETLGEEGDTDKALTALAEKSINLKAVKTH